MECGRAEESERRPSRRSAKGNGWHPHCGTADRHAESADGDTRRQARFSYNFRMASSKPAAFIGGARRKSPAATTGGIEAHSLHGLPVAKKDKRGRWTAAGFSERVFDFPAPMDSEADSQRLLANPSQRSLTFPKRVDGGNMCVFNEREVALEGY